MLNRVSSIGVAAVSLTVEVVEESFLATGGRTFKFSRDFSFRKRRGVLLFKGSEVKNNI